jgi:hypothetical protein
MKSRLPELERDLPVASRYVTFFIVNVMLKIGRVYRQSSLTPTSAYRPLNVGM